LEGLDEPEFKLPEVVLLDCGAPEGPVCDAVAPVAGLGFQPDEIPESLAEDDEGLDDDAKRINAICPAGRVVARATERRVTRDSMLVSES
jgi:hypothetical protein